MGVQRAFFRYPLERVVPCDPTPSTRANTPYVAHSERFPVSRPTTLLFLCFSAQMRGLAAVVILLCLTSALNSGDVKPKWWSIPEPVATVGKLFYFKIPQDSVIDNTDPVDVSVFQNRSINRFLSCSLLVVCGYISVNTIECMNIQLWCLVF